MSTSSAAIAVLLAFGFGWIARAFALNPVIPATVLFQSTVTVAVAWWIQSALKRNAELSRVPMEAADTACGRIHEMTNDCLSKPQGTLGNDPALVLLLRALDHEISWLCLVASTLGCENTASAMLRNSYEELYDAASIEQHLDHTLCFAVGQRLRARTLRVQWAICEQSLKGGGNTSKLRTAIHNLTN